MAKLEIKVETNVQDFAHRIIHILKHLVEIYDDKEFDAPFDIEDFVQFKKDQPFRDGVLQVNLELTPRAVDLIGLDVLREFEFPYLPEEVVN